MSDAAAGGAGRGRTSHSQGDTDLDACCGLSENYECAAGGGFSDLRTGLAANNQEGEPWPSILTSLVSRTGTPHSPRVISLLSMTCSPRTCCGTEAGGVSYRVSSAGGRPSTSTSVR